MFVLKASPNSSLMGRMSGLGSRLWYSGFSTPKDALLTVVFLGALAAVAAFLFDWAVLGAVWSAEDVDTCPAASGACWAVIDARHRLILFGLYPYEEHWRSTLAGLSVIVTVVLSCFPAFWRFGRLAVLWTAGFTTYYLLMEGSLIGLRQVTPDHWGGLSLTLLLFSSVVLLGLPMGLALALMKRSDLPVISGVASILVDFIRSIPLLVTLFTAAVVIPFMLPDWLIGDKIWRVIAAFALFFACYQAEALQGGFQAVPKGQFESGKALGMTDFQVHRRIILPQVYKHALPGTINIVVVTFEQTAIVVIIGFFDMLASAHAAFGTGKWAPYYVEVYAFVGLIYWAFIFSLSQYGAFLERRLDEASRK